MNPAVAHVALILVGVGIVLFLLFLALVGGCRPPPLPPEGPWTETVAKNARDR